jgi:pSer/pThr/pTyr-binding forkhead associated (FHA) protein
MAQTIKKEETKLDVNLVLFKKDGTKKSFSMPDNITVIGRRHDCDLHVPLMVVSRRHCELFLNNDTLKVRDLDSRGGTFLNGKRIAEATVQPGDYLRIGPLTFLLQIDGAPVEIAPPKPPERKAAPKAAPKEKPAAEAPAAQAPIEALDDSFPDLEIDESDSFLAELEDL